jgi:hypothetical protein
MMLDTRCWMLDAGYRASSIQHRLLLFCIAAQ